MNNNPIRGSVLASDGGMLAINTVVSKDGEQMLLLSLESEDGSAAEVLLPTTEAREVGIDLIVFARLADDENEENLLEEDDYCPGWEMGI